MEDRSLFTHLPLYISLQSQIQFHCFKATEGKDLTPHMRTQQNQAAVKDTNIFPHNELYIGRCLQKPQVCVIVFCLNPRIMVLVRKLLTSHSDAQKKTTVNLKSTAYLHIREVSTAAATDSRLAGFFFVIFYLQSVFLSLQTLMCIAIVRVKAAREFTVGLNQRDFLFCRDKIYWG